MFCRDFDDDRPNDLQWKHDRRAEVREFESFLRDCFPGAPIVVVSEHLESAWEGFISAAENLDDRYCQEDIGIRPDGLWYPGYTYYGWLCELKYCEQFLEWLAENYRPEERNEPERLKGWAVVRHRV